MREVEDVSSATSIPSGIHIPVSHALLPSSAFSILQVSMVLNCSKEPGLKDPQTYLPALAVRSGIGSIQALFAAQLFLVTVMSLRAASTVVGLPFRSIFLAGLHHFPASYGELSSDDCDMKKRIFWSAFVIDRYLPQALGHPLGIQDSDIDACFPTSPELHISVVPDMLDMFGGVAWESLLNDINYAQAWNGQT